MKVSSIFMGCLLLAIFVAMVAIAATYPAGARFQPFVIGIPAIALCILQIVLDIVQRREVKTAGSGGNEYARAEAEIARATGRKVEFEVAHQDMPHEETLSQEGELRRELTVWGFFLGFIAIVIGFGFWIAIPIFLFLFLHTQAEMKIPKALLMAAIGSGVFYTMFEIVLRVKVHEGFLRPWVFEQIQPLFNLLGLPIKL